MTIRTMAHILTWATTAFCVVRGLPVLIEGWKYLGAHNGSAAAQDGNGKGNGMNRAVFFDVDGTLTELPSLERRYFERSAEGKVSLRNANLRGFSPICAPLAERLTHALQGNKAYLRGVARAGSTRIARGRLRLFFLKR